MKTDNITDNKKDCSLDLLNDDIRLLSKLIAHSFNCFKIRISDFFS